MSLPSCPSLATCGLGKREKGVYLLAQEEIERETRVMPHLGGPLALKSVDFAFLKGGF